MSREIAVRYFESLKTRDAAKVAETFHPRISSWDPLAGTAEGRENVAAAFKQLFHQMPDVAFEPKSYVIDGNRGAVEWVWTATLPNGKLRIPGMDLMEFEGGLIRSIKFYYDPTPLREKS
ncbi:MAG: nuclear transport factor 2 family protein [Candidatus Binatia bacterium]